MSGKIELIGMSFFARHGCLESERRDGNRFVVDFSCEYDTYAAGKSDDLADTIDYSRVYAIVAREMAVPSRLLEHVAGRIADALLAEIPGLGHFEISISKENPPVGGDCKWAKVSIKR